MKKTSIQAEPLVFLEEMLQMCRFLRKKTNKKAKQTMLVNEKLDWSQLSGKKRDTLLYTE